ncbi:hypothetical protein ACP4OV_007650 [Aristida adscensionis]
MFFQLLSLNPNSSRSSVNRIIKTYGPVDLSHEFLPYDVVDATPPVLAKIGRCYRRARLEPEVWKNSGFCFGLLDPISNIVVNSAISLALGAPPRAEGGDLAGDGDMETRSLNGLVAFLTYLFPYLPEAEALGYLEAADADPLAACLLIIDKRGMRQFAKCSTTTVVAVLTALRCAAAAAQHPNPEQLILGRRGLMLNLQSIFCCEKKKHDDAGTSHPDLELEDSWELAEKRRVNTSGKGLPPVWAAMKRILLKTIHGFYLQAMARLPTAELSSVYHHVMLMGGYCFGPLDPVSNIILNTVWFEETFPGVTSEQLTVRMISTKLLWRVVARSLYGLISFLCTRYSGLTPEEAMLRLHAAGANLQVADPNFFSMPSGVKKYRGLSLISTDSFTHSSSTSEAPRRSIEGHMPKIRVEGTTPSASTEEAYAAAATAAFHPNPTKLQNLLGSSDAMFKLHVASDVLQNGRTLDSEMITLLRLLLRSPSSLDRSRPANEKAPRMVSRRVYASISRNKKCFWDQHERVLGMVEAALDNYNRDKESCYRLHVICGVNELASGPEFSTDKDCTAFHPCGPFKFHHFHINFLATCEDTQDATALAMLFFAECSNHGTDKSWCVPVSQLHRDAEQVRCIYCENQGIGIVHSTEMSFHGLDTEFEKVLRGEPFFHGTDTSSYANDWNIETSGTFLDWVHPLEDDSIYDRAYVDDGACDEEKDHSLGDYF